MPLNIKQKKVKNPLSTAMDNKFMSVDPTQSPVASGPMSSPDPTKNTEFVRDTSTHITHKSDGTTEVRVGNNPPQNLTQAEEIQRNAKIAAQEGLAINTMGQPQNNISPNVQKVLQQTQQPTPPLIQPEPLGPTAGTPQFDALDAKSVIGAGVAGAGTGAAVGALAGPVGAVIGGAIGAVAGTSAAFLYSSADERKAQVATGKAKYVASTKNIQNVLNSVNQGQMSPQQARLLIDNEYQRIRQAKQEIVNAGSGLYGSKLAKNLDDEAKINGWLRNYDTNYQFIIAQTLAQPDKNKLYTDIADNELTNGN